VTTVAALSLDGHVLIDERTLLVGMALDTNRVAARQCPHLAEGGCAVRVVTIAALDKAFVDPVVIWLCKVGFGRRMASVAEVRLRSHKQGLGLLRVMRRVAVEAADIVAGV
jgi:hypothetical protein